MKKIIFALLLICSIDQAFASGGVDGSEGIHLADPDSFTSRFADAPGHRLYHMYADNGYHFETQDRYTNKWISFEGNYETSKTFSAIEFDFRVESKDNKIRAAYAFVYNKDKLVKVSIFDIIKNQDCPEIRPSINDEGISGGCGGGHSARSDAFASLGLVTGDMVRVWLIGDNGAQFAPQISEFKAFGTP